MKLLISFFALFVCLGSISAQKIANIEAVYPKIRIGTTPSVGEEAKFNSPSFQWVSTKKAKYGVRLSRFKDFSRDVLEKEGLPYALFNPHKKLEIGMWFWQYKVNNEAWNPVDSFTITASTRTFVTPDIKTILDNIPSTHPRVLVKKADFNMFQSNAKGYKETALIIKEANGYMQETVPKESFALPTFKGKDDFENEKIANNASKAAGRRISQTLNTLSQAYILTGDTRYFNTSKQWMLDISKWDPNGPTHTSNFADAAIMSSLAIGVDTFWDLLTPTERETIIKHISIRANQFYKLWVGQVESRSSSMHVWQHILHHLLQTSLALKDEVPEAKLWMAYIYELWIAQSPKMAEKDGAWFNGTSYFGMNTLSLIDISAIFKDLSGVDFMGSEWFKNNPRWLIYAFPPNSICDGFCNDGEKYVLPSLRYAGYTDALARLMNNPDAAWYAQADAKSLNKEIADDEEFRWFRIKTGLKMPLPAPAKEFNLPQAAVFPEIGVAYMHTTVQKAETNLMLSVRSSPYGPMAHAHADQNTFNIAYGGKRLFYNTGYRPAMGDPHFLDWYKHTKGHNGILIDGQGQPFSPGAYGWLPRFLHGNQISYAVGDASNAYSGTDEGKTIDHGVTVSKRHYILLRPSTIVIYDELEADHAAEWSWLLHNDNGLKIDANKKTIFAESAVAKAKVGLYASSPIDFKVTDQFSIPVDNWTNKIDEEGDTLHFIDQWHFKGISKEKTAKMRYLAIFQIKPDGHFQEVISNKNDGHFTVGNWTINAEMSTSKPAHIKVWNNDNTDSLVSDGNLIHKGKTYTGKEMSSSKLLEMIGGKPIFQEVIDVMPEAMIRAMGRN